MRRRKGLGEGVLACILGTLLMTGLLVICSGELAGMQGKTETVDYVKTCMMDCGWLQKPICVEEEVAIRMSLLADEDSTEEYLKALSVVIRSELLARGSKDELGYGDTDEDSSSVPAIFQMCEKAAKETKGIYLSYQNHVIAPLWTRVSNGTTRDGSECHMKEDAYFKKRVCKDDILSPLYASEKEWKRTAFISEFEKELAEENRDEWAFGWPDMVCERDSADYVVKVYLGKNKTPIDGGVFAERLGLSSPCFTWKYMDDTLVFQVKGYGHGFGMSLNQAKNLAMDGKQFMEILDYFYPGTILDKCY